MCWFLTMAIPPGRPLPAAERGGLHIHIRACHANGFPDGWQCFEVSSGGCACGLYALPDAATPSVGKTTESLRETYRRKGWSAAKIERALRDRIPSQVRQAERFSTPDRFLERVAEWADSYGQICVLAHWEGRECDGMTRPAGRLLDVCAEDVLRSGFPPETVVRIRGVNTGRRHGQSLAE